MADELAGRPEFAARHYGFAAKLSEVRDRVARLYEDARP